MKPGAMMALVSAALVVAAAFTIGLPPVAGQDDPLRDDIWTYRHSEVYDDGSTQISIDGNLTVRCDDTDIIFLDNESVDVVTFRTSMSADVSGSAWYSAWPSPMRVSLSGTYKVEYDEYYELETWDLLRTVSNETLLVYMFTGDPPSYLGEWAYYQEMNETDYELWALYPAVDIDGQGFELDVGTTWELESTAYSHVTGVSGYTPFEEEWDLHEVTEYTLTGFETVTGSEGSYECLRIEHSSGDVDITEWYCPDINADAMMRTNYTDGHVTQTLLSYEPGEQDTGGGDGDGEGVDEGASDIWLALGILVPVAASGAVLLVFVWTRVKNDAEPPPPPVGGEVG